MRLAQFLRSETALNGERGGYLHEELTVCVVQGRIWARTRTLCALYGRVDVHTGGGAPVWTE